MREFLNSTEDHERDAADREPEGAEQEVLRLRREVEGLRRALETRPMIDVALGMVMATEGCSLDQAWKVLVRSSQRTNTKLRTLALRLTDSSASSISPASPHIAPSVSSRGNEDHEDATAPDLTIPAVPSERVMSERVMSERVQADRADARHLTSGRSRALQPNA